MIQSSIDPCLYFHKDNSVHNFFALAIYVDDIITVDNISNLREIIQQMSKDFKIKDIGKAEWILGMQLIYSEGKINVNQQKYISDILLQHGMDKCKPVSTPIVKETLTSRGDEENKNVDKATYLQIVGSLIYVSTITRPDISYAVNKTIKPIYLPTDNMIADPLTKPIGAQQLKRVIKGLIGKP